MRLLHLRVVLAAVADDESAPTVLRGAHDLAVAAGAKLHVVHVGPPASRLESMLADAGMQGTEAQQHELDGEPATAIRALGDRIRADVIVLGRHRAADQMTESSTAHAVVSNFWAPCLILSQPLRLPLERVLVPIDLSDTARGALVIALSWASALRGVPQPAGPATDDHGAELTALYVERAIRDRQQRQSGRHRLDEELSHIRKDAGSWAHVAINGAVAANDDAPLAIADYVREHRADLVVLGTRGVGLDGKARLGSVSLGVMVRVSAPVLLVPPAVWISYAAGS